MPRAARRKAVRLTQATFTVSVAAIVVNENGEVLLLDHVLRPASGWGFPGGFLDVGESPEDAIKREVCEETGVELKDLVIGRVAVLGSHVEIIYFAKARGDARVLTSEIYRLGWFAASDFPQGMNNAQRSLAADLLEGRV